MAQSCSPFRYPIDIFLSHDWPKGIWEFGDKNHLLRKKPYFAEDIENGTLGSPPLLNLLRKIKPRFWFSAHLHMKFAAVVAHNSNTNLDAENVNDVQSKSDAAHEYLSNIHCTRFLALDKVLPGRDFLQIISINCNIEHESYINREKVSSPIKHESDNTSTDKFPIFFDAEWLSVMKKTHHLLSKSRNFVNLPSIAEYASDEDINATREQIVREFGSLQVSNILPTNSLLL
jgi:lariat debranching enzyme